MRSILSPFVQCFSPLIFWICAITVPLASLNVELSLFTCFFFFFFSSHFSDFVFFSSFPCDGTENLFCVCTIFLLLVSVYCYKNTNLVINNAFNLSGTRFKPLRLLF